MPLDVRELATYYDGPAGQVARRIVLHRVRAVWPNLSNMRILGLGHAMPYLRPFMPEAERVLAVAPAAQGAQPWGNEGRGLVAVSEDRQLPFPDAMFDRVLLVHELEGAESQRHLMRELWRVLTQDGRLMIVVTNRTSLWAQFETTPFGHGRPYSRSQLERLLKESMFLPESWDTALHMPPFRKRRPSFDMSWERMGRRMWPKFAGVHIVEASKSMYAPVLVGKVATQQTPATA